MPSERPLSRKEFVARMEIEAKKLERFARELREGKWDTFDIEESFDGGRGAVQEKATIIIRASRLQAYGTGRTVMTDGEESSPRRATHQFEGSWQPHPEKRGDEHERYEETCSGCSLTIVEPTDAHVIDHFPPVEALTPEWLTMMGYPAECVSKPEQKRPYAPPTLRVLDPHEVIRKLLKASEQANGVPGGGEHQGEQGAREAKPPKLGHLAVSGQPIDQRASDREQHGNESDHG